MSHGVLKKSDSRDVKTYLMGLTRYKTLDVQNGEYIVLVDDTDLSCLLKETFYKEINKTFKDLDIDLVVKPDQNIHAFSSGIEEWTKFKINQEGLAKLLFINPDFWLNQNFYVYHYPTLLPVNREFTKEHQTVLSWLWKHYKPLVHLTQQSRINLCQRFNDMNFSDDVVDDLENLGFQRMYVWLRCHHYRRSATMSFNKDNKLYLKRVIDFYGL